MTQIHFFRAVGKVAASCFLAATLLVGCADTSTGPLPPDSDPLGYNATVNQSDPVPAEEANEVRENVRKTSVDTVTITPDSVVHIVRKEYPDGEILGINLDYDRDILYYECIVRSGGRTYIVVVSTKDGKVKEKREITRETHSYTTVIVIEKIKVIRIKEIRERAIKVVNGDIVEINIEEIEGKPTYVVVILTRENRYVTIFIDAENGKERKLKNNGECDDDDDDDRDHKDRHKNKKGRGHYRHGKGKGYGHRYHCHCECVDDRGERLPTGVISVDSATALTRTMVDSAQTREVRILVQDSNKVFYEIKVVRDSNAYTLKLDAFNGSLVEARQTGGNMQTSEFRPQVKGDTLVALSVARTAALAQVPGTVTGWRLENDATEKKWIYTFEITPTGGGDKKGVQVDAKTGAYIRTK